MNREELERAIENKVAGLIRKVVFYASIGIFIAVVIAHFVALELWRRADFWQRPHPAQQERRAK